MHAILKRQFTKIFKSIARPHFKSKTPFKTEHWNTLDYQHPSKQSIGIYYITWYISKYLDRLVHSFVCISDIFLNGFCVDGREGIVHPTLMPSQPIRNCYPKVAERLKFLSKATKFLILEHNKSNNDLFLQTKIIYRYFF